MKLQFDSLNSFIHMNGHGLYVWLAYGIAFVVLTLVLVAPAFQKRALQRQAKRVRQLQQDLARENYPSPQD